MFFRKRFNKKLFTGKLISKMADYETKAVTADASGDMIFEPILEDGVFRFDCSASDRDAAYPSLSFVNSKARDTPIKSHNVPSYIPTFKCLLGQYIVKFEVSYLFFLFFIFFPLFWLPKIFLNQHIVFKCWNLSLVLVSYMYFLWI